MSEVTILPVKPGTLTKADKAELKKAGVIVVEHESPGELRLITPTATVSSGDLLYCAMKALRTNTGVSAQSQRETFAVLLANLVEASHDA